MNHLAVEPLRFGIVVYPRITQLDATGPCEVFASLENATVELVGAGPVACCSDRVENDRFYRWVFSPSAA